MSDDAQTPPDGPSRTSFSSRLLTDMEPAQLPSSPPSTPVVRGEVNGAGAPEGDLAHGGCEADPGTHSPRSGPGLSLASIAKAERALARPVTIASGGTHVAFTREDVARLRDPSVLRFMEENSGLFAKYMDRPTAAGPPVTSQAPCEGTAAQLEEDIASLQRAIDTFITAVDEDGRSYRILAGEDGTVVVPVADDEDDGGGAGPPLWGDEPGTATPLDAAAVEAELQQLLEEGSEATLSRPATPPAATPPLVSHPTSRRPRRPAPPTSAPAKAGAPPRLARGPSPAIFTKPVRPVRALAPAEEARVAEVLSMGAALVGEASPFEPPAEVAARVKVIDDRLGALRVGRGALRVDSEGPSALVGAAADGVEGGPRRLGDTYMREAAAAARYRRQLRVINGRLLRLHEESERLAAAADASELPADIAAMRPAWMLATAPPPPDAEALADMLAEAAEEDRRCALLGLAPPDCPPPRAVADPYAALRSAAGEARRRALELLATLEGRVDGSKAVERTKVDDEGEQQQEP